MAGEGGGAPIVNPEIIADVFSEQEWEQAFGSGSADNRPPDYMKRSWVAKNVPWFTKEAWKDKASREWLIQAAYDVWRSTKWAKPRSRVAAELRRTQSGQEFLRQNTARSQGTTQPPQGKLPGQPPLGPGYSNLEKILWLVRTLGSQWMQRDQQLAAQRAAKAQARAMRAAGGSGMPLLSGIGFGGVPTGDYSVGFPTSGGGGWGSTLLSALPAITGAAAPLISRLFEQEAADAPDVLERLGLATGLEGAVEREATFWIPSAAGVRANREIIARNPVSGRFGTWRYMGRPVLYSGDLATCKRVGKVASRAARFSGRRTLRRGRRR